MAKHNYNKTETKNKKVENFSVQPKRAGFKKARKTDRSNDRFPRHGETSDKPEVFQRKRDGFFKKSRSNNETLNKNARKKDKFSRRQNDDVGSFDKAHSSSKFKNKIQNKKVNKNNQNDGNTGSDDFFVKPSENAVPSKSSEQTKTEKAPFDKKKWRMQRYSKKYKLQQWEEKRKKVVMREYYRQVKNDEPKLDVQKIYKEFEENEEGDEGISTEPHNTDASNVEKDSSFKNEKPQAKRAKRFLPPHEKFKHLNQEKEEKRAARLKKMEEKKAALEAYKKNKAEKFRKLSQKTRKGQPIMKHRIDMLLEQIQKTMN